jgi:outer membrane protein TolC
MGLPPTTVYQVAAAKVQKYPVPAVTHSAEHLERFALVSRPEVQEERYNVRIAQTETRRAMMRFLPNVNPFAMVAYDSNSYLVHNNWAEIGLRAGMNLLSLAALPTAQELAERQVELAQARKLAVSMAVVAQVHVALQQFNRSHRQFEAASQVARVERRLSALSTAGQLAQSSSELDRVRFLTSALAAELQRDRAYADLMNAHAALHVALGLDPVPGEDSRTLSLDALSASIRAVQTSWWTGAIELPPVPDGLPAIAAPGTHPPPDGAQVRN